VVTNIHILYDYISLCKEQKGICVACQYDMGDGKHATEGSEGKQGT